MKITKLYIPFRNRNKDLITRGGGSEVTIGGSMGGGSTTVVGGGGGTGGGSGSHDDLTDVRNVGDPGTEGARDLHVTYEQGEALKTFGKKNFFEELLKKFNKFFLRKDIPDTAEEVITFDKGLITGGSITSKGFNPAAAFTWLGSGFGIERTEEGNWQMVVDKLMVRKQMDVHTLVINEIKSVGGQILLTMANQTNKEVEDKGDYYRCYFETDDGTIKNMFEVGDMAVCQKFDGKNIKRYWRAVVGMGEDYIDLSKNDREQLSDGIPEAGDEVVQLGNKTNKDRQHAILLSAYGNPGFFQFSDINSYSLENKDRITISPKYTKFTANEFVVQTGKRREALYNSRVGAKNLLREYDGRFKFKYWGDNGQLVDVEINIEQAIRLYLATEDGRYITTESKRRIDINN